MRRRPVAEHLAVATAYAMPRFLASHYPADVAVAQKIAALAHRTETQARDVFDIAHLLGRLRGAPVTVDRADAERAVERALSVSYDDYAAQVAAFLEPEHADLYASRDAWDAMQLDVVERLQALAR